MSPLTCAIYKALTRSDAHKIKVVITWSCWVSLNLTTFTSVSSCSRWSQLQQVTKYSIRITVSFQGLLGDYRDFSYNDTRYQSVTVIRPNTS